MPFVRNHHRQLAMPGYDGIQLADDAQLSSNLVGQVGHCLRTGR